ncbi:MAG: hypothetical protein LBT24_03355, partial [Tannerella sp.]|nr:hypothetical protein [Tannerella sp.]
AQEDERKHEISLGAGIFSTSNLAFAYGDAIVNSIDFAGNVKFEEQVASPVFHLNYKYFTSKRFSIGVTLTAGTEKANGMAENQYDGKLKRFYSNIAIEPVYNYINKKYFKLYLLAGAGLLYLHQDYTPENRDKKGQTLYTFDFQLTPIGIKVGNTLGAYLEGGIGYKGIISCGVFYRF